MFCGWAERARGSVDGRETRQREAWRVVDAVHTALPDHLLSLELRAATFSNKTNDSQSSQSLAYAAAAVQGNTTKDLPTTGSERAGALGRRALSHPPSPGPRKGRTRELLA